MQGLESGTLCKRIKQARLFSECVDETLRMVEVRSCYVMQRPRPLELERETDHRFAFTFDFRRTCCHQILQFNIQPRPPRRQINS